MGGAACAFAVKGYELVIPPQAERIQSNVNVDVTLPAGFKIVNVEEE